MPKQQERINLSIGKSSTAVLFNVEKYNDVELTATISELPSLVGCNISLYIYKQSSKELINQIEDITTSGSGIVINVLNGAFDSPGICKGQFLIKDSAGQVSSAIFYFSVSEGITGDSAIINEVGVQRIEKIEDDIETLKQGGGGTGLTPEQATNVAKIPEIETSLDNLTTTVNNHIANHPSGGTQIPTQSGNTGKVLGTDGTNLVWVDDQVGTSGGGTSYNYFSGKTGVALGDSLTHGGVYFTIAKNNLGMTSYTNLGSSGATVSTTNASNNLISVVDNLTTRYDLITIMIGTNDIAINSTPVGSLKDRSKATFLGAYRYCLETLLTKFPTSKIVVLTPPKLVAQNDYVSVFGGGGTQHDYVFAIKTLCYELSVPVLDVFSTSLCSILTKSTNYLNGTDTIHLSPSGQANLGIMLTGFLNSITSDNSTFITNKILERLADIECNMSNMKITNKSTHHHREFVDFDISMLIPSSIKSGEIFTYNNGELLINGNTSTAINHASLDSELFSDIEISGLKSGYNSVIIGVNSTNPRKHIKLFLTSTSYMGKCSVMNEDNSLSGMDSKDPEAFYTANCRSARVSIRGNIVTVYRKGEYGLLHKVAEVDVPTSYPGYVPCLGVLGIETGIRVKYAIDPIPVTDITIGGYSGDMAVGGTTQLTTTYAPANANYGKSITWTSSNNGVVTVNNSGLLTAISIGSATITATTSNGVVKTLSVTVANTSIDVTSIVVSPSTSSVGTTKTVQLSVAYTPSNANVNNTVTWSSSDTNIATVNTSGLVTGIAEGSCIITATTPNSKTSTCSMTVSATGLTTSGLVRHFDFKGYANDGSVTSVADKTGSGNTFVLTGFSYNSTSGFNNNMLYLDGTSSYALCNNFSLDQTKNWTLEVVESYSAVASNTTNDPTLTAFGQWSNPQYAGGFGGYKLGFRDSSYTNGTGTTTVLQMPSSPSVNTVVHVIYTHNATTKTITANRKSMTATSVSYTSVSLANITNLALGVKMENTTTKYAGKIGVIRYYDRILSQLEMDNNFDYELTISRS